MILRNPCQPETEKRSAPYTATTVYAAMAGRRSTNRHLPAEPTSAATAAARSRGSKALCPAITVTTESAPKPPSAPS
jgi:hypothetical protein